MGIINSLNLEVAQVYGIYGLLGGGKTLTAVEIAKDFLSYGHDVVSNILLKEPLYSNDRYHYTPDFNEVDWWKLPQGDPRGSGGSHRAAIIIDEAAEFFNQFSSTSGKVQDMLSWLRQSSKRGQFVFMIVQRPEFLVKSARSLCHCWIVCTDLAQWRFPVIKVPLPFCGNLVLRRIFDNNGNLVSRGFIVCNKYNIGRYYNTSQILNPQHMQDSPTSQGSFDFVRMIKLRYLILHLFMLFLLYKKLQ